MKEKEEEERQYLTDMSIMLLQYIFSCEKAEKKLQALIDLEEEHISVDDVDTIIRNGKRCQKLKKILEANRETIDNAYEIFDQYGARLDELEGYVDESDTIYITPDDIIVKTYTFKCVKHAQKLNNVKIVVDSSTDNSMTRTELVAGKCPKCNAYYVMANEVERAQLDGILLCRIVDEDMYRKRINNNDDSSKYNEQSILMEFGYSVSKERGLTENQRQTILAYIIDKQICSATEILSYLRWFVETRTDNPRYKSAIDKWETDMEFVRNYKPRKQSKLTLKI